MLLIVMLKTDTNPITVIFIKFAAVHGNIWAEEGWGGGGGGFLGFGNLKRFGVEEEKLWVKI